MMIEEKVSFFQNGSNVFKESCNVGLNCVQPLCLSTFKYISCLL